MPKKCCERTGLIPNDPYITNATQWYITKVQSYEAWDLSTGSANVVVAVVDDAMKLTHEDLAANMWINTDKVRAMALTMMAMVMLTM